MYLLKTRRFLPLFITQFLGAFNDNMFKNALVVLIAFRLASDEPGQAQMLVTLAAALFILPYFLFSATAGQCADKFDKALMARATKVWEVIIMTIAAIGFFIGNTYFLLFVLFCLGIQATFFGPIKYALLPQHLRSDELIAGNAYIETSLFLGILLGTILGGLIILHPLGVYWISMLTIIFALLGYISSRFIPAAPAAVPHLKIDWNIARETWNVVGHDRKNKVVFRCIMAISWFWLVGGTFLAQFPSYAKDILHADETVVTLFLTVFSIGIGFGSQLCNALIKGTITSRTGRLIPLGALGICLFGIDLFFASARMHGGQELMSAMGFLHEPAGWRVLIDLLGISVAGGIYIVPLYAIMQHKSDESHRARTIASNNIVNALFMVLSSIITLVMLKMGLSIPMVFLCVALATGVIAWILSRSSFD